jgi:hypothetical protein
MLKAHTSYADNLEADEAIQNGMITLSPKAASGERSCPLPPDSEKIQAQPAPRNIAVDSPPSSTFNFEKE